MKLLQPYAYKGIDIRFYFEKGEQLFIVSLLHGDILFRYAIKDAAYALFDNANENGYVRQEGWDAYSEENRRDIISLILSYDYLNEDMQSLLEAQLSTIVKQSDLKKWNNIQKDLWIKTTKKLNIDKNDIDKFFKFGRFFYEFVSKYNKTPTIKEIRGLYDI